VNYLRCNTHDLTRKKFRSSTYIISEIWYPGFHKTNLHVISIHLNKHNNNYVKHKSLDGTKHTDISFTRNTHFHQLRNTVYLCRLQPNYHSESKNLTGMNILRCNTHDLRRKKILFFLYNPWNIILWLFKRETWTWYRFMWTSTILPTSNIKV
jgi:hypothetical protein